MARRAEPLWKDYLGSLAIAYVFAAAFSFVAPIPWPQRIASAGVSGFVFGTMFFVLGTVTTRIKIRSFVLQCIFRSVLICGTLVVGLLIVIPMSIAMLSGRYPWDPKVLQTFGDNVSVKTLGVWIGIGFGLSIGLNGFYQISKKLGPGVLWNWITGKYYAPKEEERIFMFLDLKNSTTLAEKLGNLQFSRLCQEFFRDLSYPVATTKGEVSHYIGDEAVLTWKPDRGLEKANCIQCFFLMKNEIEQRADFYRATFGFVPEFKAGVHVGKVVAAEVGEIKSEIVYHGDVLNTTARITGMCAELRCDLLMSGDLRARLDLPAEIATQSLGMRLLKGKEHEVEIVAVQSESEPPIMLDELHITRAQSLPPIPK